MGEPTSPPPMMAEPTTAPPPGAGGDISMGGMTIEAEMASLTQTKQVIMLCGQRVTTKTLAQLVIGAG